MAEPAVIVVAAGGEPPAEGNPPEVSDTVTQLTIELCDAKIQECETRICSRMDAMESRITDSLSSLFQRAAETEQIAEEAQATAEVAVVIAESEPEPETTETVEVIPASEPESRSEPENPAPRKKRHWLF